MTGSDKNLLKNLNGQGTEKVPFWLMRQAGRYLPEYRELRTKKGGFLAMVYDPETASEITMQPIRRFGMNGAILFSDILVIPQALGQDLRFETGEGPKLSAIRDAKGLAALSLDKIDDVLNPVYDTVSLTAAKLKKDGFDDTALIGFAGAPWTVATYMVEGGSSKEFAQVKKWAYAEPDGFSVLIDLVSEATIHYLKKQIAAGAEAIKIFDSWAGVLDEKGFDAWVITPAKKIVSALKADYPHIPVIGFPRGASPSLAQKYADETGIDCLACDYSLSRADMQELQKNICVQGNLDPAVLLAGGVRLEETVRALLEGLSDKPYIFNLGHGVIKETPPEHVAQLAAIIREFKR